MIIALKPNADPERVTAELRGKGLWVQAVVPSASHRSDAGALPITSQLVVNPRSCAVPAAQIEGVDGVLAVYAAPSQHPLVDAHGPSVTVAGAVLSAEAPALIAGPCSVESKEQIATIAAAVAARGARLLRGGAYKPRSSPYAFCGSGIEGLRWLRDAADANGLAVVTEAVGESDVGPVAEHADMVQVGSRNMQNFALLKAVGAAGKPVLLKRAMAATVGEWLLAGEYLLKHGARGVAFCERGVRGFDGQTRNLLDMGSVALLAHVHRLPVVVDPSHATGRRELIVPLARAALAAGASGVMVEVHDRPESALSDGPQALLPEALEQLDVGTRTQRRAS